MKTLYIYNISDFCYNLYKKYPYQLYKLLEQTYYTSKYDKYQAISSYEQLIEKFNKQFIHDFIFNNHKLDAYYHFKNQTHIILDRKEYSKLLVSVYSLKLITNTKFTNFFSSINKYNENIFICDFENNDYFWLDKIVKKNKNIINQ